MEAETEAEARKFAKRAPRLDPDCVEPPERLAIEGCDDFLAFVAASIVRAVSIQRLPI
jgi:hypothetical protein